MGLSIIKLFSLIKLCFVVEVVHNIKIAAINRSTVV